MARSVAYTRTYRRVVIAFNNYINRYSIIIYKLYCKARNFRGTFAGFIEIASFCSNINFVDR